MGKKEKATFELAENLRAVTALISHLENVPIRRLTFLDWPTPLS